MRSLWKPMKTKSKAAAAHQKKHWNVKKMLGNKHSGLKKEGIFAPTKTILEAAAGPLMPN